MPFIALVALTGCMEAVDTDHFEALSSGWECRNSSADIPARGPLVEIDQDQTLSLSVSQSLNRRLCVANLGCSGCSRAARYRSGELAEFLQFCEERGVRPRFCRELARPNPSSVEKFNCTYGTSTNSKDIQSVRSGCENHPVLIPPNRTRQGREVWNNAIYLIGIVQRHVQAQTPTQSCHIVERINNWWRPTHYNANVGGASDRHPHATAIDVLFCSTEELIDFVNNVACPLLRRGRLRSVGTYGGSRVVHIGIETSASGEETWGPHRCR